MNVVVMLAWMERTQTSAVFSQADDGSSRDISTRRANIRFEMVTIITTTNPLQLVFLIRRFFDACIARFCVEVDAC